MVTHSDWFTKNVHCLFGMKLTLWTLLLLDSKL